MNEERNNMTVTISGRCRNEDGTMEDLVDVYENVQSVFGCFFQIEDNRVHQDSVILGGFNNTMWSHLMKVIAEDVGVEPFLMAVMHVAGQMSKTASAGGFEK